MNCCDTALMMMLALPARSSRPSRREGEDVYSRTTVLRQKKKLPQHRNTRRKSFDIGRISALEFAASRSDTTEKCSVAAEPATKPQHHRNKTQQAQAIGGVNAAVNAAVNTTVARASRIEFLAINP